MIERNTKKLIYFFLFSFFLLTIPIVEAQEFSKEYIRPLTRSIADTIYCLVNGVCNTTLVGQINISGELDMVGFDIINIGTVFANFLQGALNFTFLQNYPTACPPGFSVVEVGDTLTCTNLTAVVQNVSISASQVEDIWVNQTGDIMTGNLNMTLNSILAVSDIQFRLDTNDSFFFYNESNESLFLIVNGEAQQKWGSSTTIFGEATFLDNAFFANIFLESAEGDDIILNTSLIVLGNTTSGLFIGNGSGLTDVCLSNGTGCDFNVSLIFNLTGLGDTHVAGDQDFLTNDSTTMFFNNTKLNNTISLLIQLLSFDGFFTSLDFTGTIGFDDFTDNDTNTEKAGGSPFLFNDSDFIFFNETLLNQTILIKINETDFWENNNDTIFLRNFSKKIGIGINQSKAKLHVQSKSVPFAIKQCKNGVACYTFEIGQRDLAVDSSRFLNFGIIRDAIRVASKGGNGTGNKSLFFDENSFVSASSITEIELDTDFSFGAWINQTVDKESIIIQKINNASSGYSLFLRADNRLHVTINQNGTLLRKRTTATIPPNEWHQVAAVVNGSTVSLYIDGILQSLQSHTRPLVGDSTQLFIGMRSDITQGWGGNIDEVGIINVSLNSSVILDVFNNGFNFIDFNVTILNDDLLILSGNISVFTPTSTELIVDKLGRVGIDVDKPSFTLEVAGVARFFDEVIFTKDIFVGGNIIGGSPVKVAGGFNVLTGDVNISDGNIEQVGEIFTSNLTSDNIVVAQEFIDLTRSYDKNQSESKRELLNIRNTKDNEINHSTLPDFVKTQVITRDRNGNKVATQGRSIGALVTMLVEAIKALEQENNDLKDELCNESRNAYSWC